VPPCATVSFYGFASRSTTGCPLPRCRPLLEKTIAGSLSRSYRFARCGEHALRRLLTHRCLSACCHPSPQLSIIVPTIASLHHRLSCCLVSRPSSLPMRSSSPASAPSSHPLHPPTHASESLWSPSIIVGTPLFCSNHMNLAPNLI
jgi:hypothetical protein